MVLRGSFPDLLQCIHIHFVTYTHNFINYVFCGYKNNPTIEDISLTLVLCFLLNVIDCACNF